MLGTRSYYDLVIFIIGPNNLFYYQSILDFLTKKNDNIVVIGDGEIDILNNKNGGMLLDTLSFIKQNNSFLFDVEKILVYVHAHAINNNQKYTIALGYPLEVKDFFQILNEQINKPLDIIYFPCFGKTALSYINYLPANSNLIIFSDEDSSTVALNIFATFAFLENVNIFSLEVFYDVYLGHLTKIENPVLVNKFNVLINPLSLVYLYLGKKVDSLFLEYVNNHFIHNICQDSLNCHESNNQLINRFENAASIHEFLATGHKYRDLSKMIDNWQAEMSNSTANYCSKQILVIKEQIDQYLFVNNIPLEVDLSYEFWYEWTDNDFDLTDLSERAIYDGFVMSFFKANNNFPEPEYLEIGKVFGIVKDLYSCSMATNTISHN